MSGYPDSPTANSACKLIRHCGFRITKWSALGADLDVPIVKREQFRLERLSLEDSLEECLDYWIRSVPGNKSWESLCDIVERHEKNTAKQMRVKLGLSTIPIPTVIPNLPTNNTQSGLPTIPIPTVIPNLPTNNTQSDAPDDTLVNEGNDETDRNDLEEEEEEGKTSTAKDGGGFEEYPLRGMKHCVIINNEKFDKLKERRGSSEDVLKVEQLFGGKLGFVVHRRENLKGAQILHEIENIKVEVEKRSVGCHVLVIMSHGDSLQQKDIASKTDEIPGDGIVYGTDGVRIKIADIVKKFAGNSFPKLIDKPKVFFIHACRGETDYGVSLPEDEEEEGESIPTEADMLVAYAAAYGRTAIRHRKNGSWFIQDLVNALDKYSEDHDLVSILTEVNAQVAGRVTKLTGKKEMPCFSSHLRKKLYFRPESNRIGLEDTTQ